MIKIAQNGKKGKAIFGGFIIQMNGKLNSFDPTTNTTTYVGNTIEDDRSAGYQTTFLLVLKKETEIKYEDIPF